MELLPKWKMLDDGDICYIDTPIGNQTLHMEFGMSDWTMDTIWFNVYMTLYNKKKQIKSNENHIKMTGANPMKTVAAALKAFKELEKEVLYSYNHKYNIIVYCNWLDNRRRDAYYKVLSRWGYRYGRDPIDGTKWIFKKWNKGDSYKIMGR